MQIGRGHSYKLVKVLAPHLARKLSSSFLLFEKQLSIFQFTGIWQVKRLLQRINNLLVSFPSEVINQHNAFGIIMAGLIHFQVIR